jgi:hypothetical protein
MRIAVFSTTAAGSWGVAAGAVGGEGGVLEDGSLAHPARKNANRHARAQCQGFAVAMPKCAKPLLILQTKQLSFSLF